MSADRAAAWLDAHVDGFRVESGSLRFPSIKAIGELAHAAERLRRPTWLAHAWHALEEGALLDTIIGEQPRHVLCATLLPVFARAGLVSRELLAKLAQQAERAVLSREEWGYVAPALEALGIPAPAAAIARRSLLAERPLPWILDLAATYQLVHETFYATDWGAAPERLAADSAQYLGHWLPVWTAFYCDAGDTDLVAELVLSAHCAGICAEPAAWRLLAAAQRSDGAVSPPAHRRVDFGATEDARADFAHHQHTTLVAALAWASCRHPSSIVVIER